MKTERSLRAWKFSEGFLGRDRLHMFKRVNVASTLVLHINRLLNNWSAL